MIGFTFTAEQLRTAPPEVRRWVEREIAASLGALGGPERAPAPPHAPSLAACSAQEALQLFEMLKGDFLLAQVFFELARETPPGRAAAPLHAIDIADMLRHTRLADGDRLADCLGAIDRAFREIRGDAEATLFGFDAAGHVYVHETTHHSVRRLWEQLAARPGAAAEPAPSGFALPRLGPSEDIASHVGAAS
jgi:hypothetical protein